MNYSYLGIYSFCLPHSIIIFSWTGSYFPLYPPQSGTQINISGNNGSDHFVRRLGFPLLHICPLKVKSFTILENPKGVAGMTVGTLREERYPSHACLVSAVPCLGVCRGLPSPQPVFCLCAQTICLGVLVLDSSDSFILLREGNYVLTAWASLFLL